MGALKRPVRVRSARKRTTMALLAVFAALTFTLLHAHGMGEATIAAPLVHRASRRRLRTRARPSTAPAAPAAPAPALRPLHLHAPPACRSVAALLLWRRQRVRGGTAAGPGHTGGRAAHRRVSAPELACRSRRPRAPAAFPSTPTRPALTCPAPQVLPERRHSGFGPGF